MPSGSYLPCMAADFLMQLDGGSAEHRACHSYFWNSGVLASTSRTCVAAKRGGIVKKEQRIRLACLLSRSGSNTTELLRGRGRRGRLCQTRLGPVSTLQYAKTSRCL
ncbi:unnamed protein product [Prorocentrum cordatum]|uniref:Uncharacterized protein n=1 Tax=Prorocentrum cordatum TaxID=2364126 RepID=A0ABN9TCB1_9DINO|nr:unnamed protein product [Polarella glacialis]